MVWCLFALLMRGIICLCRCVASPDEACKLVGWVKEYLPKRHPNSCPGKAGEEGKGQHDKRCMHQRTAIERLQASSWIMGGLELQLNKTAKVAEVEDHASSQCSPQFSSSPGRSEESSSRCHHESSNQLSTQWIEANIDDDRDQAAGNGVIEER